MPPSRFLAALTKTEDFQMVSLELEAGVLGDRTHVLFHRRSSHFLDTPAAVAHQVVVMFVDTDRIGMAAIFSMDAVQYPQIGQKIERPENSCPAHASGRRLGEDLSGGETTRPAQSGLDHCPPRSRCSKPSCPQAVHNP